MGKGLKALNVNREDIVVSTKIFWGSKPTTKNDANIRGLSRKHVIEAANLSL